jgi:hypothetical protein
VRSEAYKVSRPSMTTTAMAADTSAYLWKSGETMTIHRDDEALDAASDSRHGVAGGI